MDFVELPNVGSKNINALSPLRLGNFVIIRHPKSKRVYMGEVLDIYTQGSGSRYGSLVEVDGISGLSALTVHVYRPVNIGSVCDSFFN